MICEGLKLVLTPFVSYLISWLFNRVSWSDIGDGFEYLGSNHDTVFGYFIANIFVSFGGYMIGVVACSMAIQKLSFALPITLMTPISFLIAICCEKKWWAWDWLFDHEPDLNKVQFVVGLAVFLSAFLAQSLSTTYYIWRSQDMIMARERQLFWVPSYNGMCLSIFVRRIRGKIPQFVASLSISRHRVVFALFVASCNKVDESIRLGNLLS